MSHPLFIQSLIDTVVCGDAVKKLAELPDKSVDAVIRPGSGSTGPTPIMIPSCSDISIYGCELVNKSVESPIGSSSSLIVTPILAFSIR
jgi:hypothetical protein